MHEVVQTIVGGVPLADVQIYINTSAEVQENLFEDVHKKSIDGSLFESPLNNKKQKMRRPKSLVSNKKWLLRGRTEESLFNLEYVYNENGVDELWNAPNKKCTISAEAVNINQVKINRNLHMEMRNR